jgi:fatty acid desaturase
MKPSEKNTLLKWNTMLWLVAMVAPAVFSIAFASSRFPWPVILPLLLMGPMLASNRMISQAIGRSGEAN